MANTAGQPTGLPTTAPVGAQASSGNGTYTNVGTANAPVWSNATPQNNTPQGTTVEGGGGPGAPTQSPPTVVNSSQAETALNGAANNVQNYNAANTNTPTPSSPTTPTTSSSQTTPTSSTTPTTSSQPTATTPQSQTPGTATGQTVYSYSDPTTGTTSYYDQNGNPIQNFNPNTQGVTVTPLFGNPTNSGTPGGAGGYNPGASVDANGNITGTNVQAAYATGTEADVANLNAQLGQNSAKIAALGASTYATLQNLLNGTIPFTPAQSSLITATQSQFQALIGIQQTSNASTAGTAAESQARSGRYTPVNAMANVQAAVSMGNLALSSIQAQQADSIAKMEQGFQEQNYQDVLSANNAYEQSLKDSNDVLENISTTIQNSIQTARQFNYQVTQDNITNILNNAKFTYQQKQDAIQNALAQSTLDEKTKNDLAQIALQKESNNIAAGQLALAQGTFDETWDVGGSSMLGGTSGVGSTGNTNPAVTTINGKSYDANGDPTDGNGNPLNSDGSQPTGALTYNASKGGFFDANGNQVTGSALAALQNGLGANGIKIYSDGLAFYDESAFSGSPQATAFLNQARNANVIPLAAADAQIVVNLEAAKQDIQTMAQYFNQTGAPNNILEQPFSNATKNISGMYGGATAQAVAKYNTAQESLYAILSSLSESKRANGGEFEVGQMSFPTVTPGAGATLSSTGKSQLQASEANINNLIASFIPGFVPTPDPQTATPDSLLTFGANGGSMPASSAPTTITNNSAF